MSAEAEEIRGEIEFLRWLVNSLFHEMVGEMEMMWDDYSSGMNEGQLTIMETRQLPEMYQWFRQSKDDWPDVEAMDYVWGQYSAHRISERCFSETIDDTGEVAQGLIEMAQDLRDLIEFLKELIGFLI